MSEKGREAYELFVLRHWSRKALLRRNQPGHQKDGEYRNAAVQTGWEAWAECKSVLIVLPQINPETFTVRADYGKSIYDKLDELVAAVREDSQPC